jgi:hypothetical protein
MEKRSHACSSNEIVDQSLSLSSEWGRESKGVGLQYCKYPKHCLKCSHSHPLGIEATQEPSRIARLSYRSTQTPSPTDVAASQPSGHSPQLQCPRPRHHEE